MIEDGVVHWFSQHWTPVLVYFFVFIYIVLYPFTLWFSLLYFLIVDERKAMKTFAYSLVDYLRDCITILSVSPSHKRLYLLWISFSTKYSHPWC